MRVYPNAERSLTAKVRTLQPQLVQACFRGDPDEVRALLYKKEDVNYTVRALDKRKLDQERVFRKSNTPLACVVGFMCFVTPGQLTLAHNSSKLFFCSKAACKKLACN